MQPPSGASATYGCSVIMVARWGCVTGGAREANKHAIEYGGRLRWRCARRGRVQRRRTVRLQRRCRLHFRFCFH